MFDVIVALAVLLIATSVIGLWVQFWNMDRRTVEEINLIHRRVNRLRARYAAEEEAIEREYAAKERKGFL